MKRIGRWWMGVGLAMLVGTAVPAGAQGVPPVFVPFQDGNPFDPSTRGRFDDSIAGFFDFEKEFLGVARNAPALQREFETFEDEARAAVDQVPIPSGSVSISYKFDPAIDAWVREMRPFSPAMSQNARTDGRGVLTVGVGFSYLDYKTFKGDDRDDVVLIGELSRFDGTPATDAQGRPLLDVSLFQFTLRQAVTTVSLQWGLAEWVDVGVLIPVFDESFRARVVERFFLRNPDGSLQPALANADFSQVSEDPTAPPVRSRDAINLASFSVPQGNLPLLGFSSDQDEYGIGDVVLRSKAFFGSVNAIDVGGLMNVSLPTGDEDDLLGVGSVRLDPRLLFSGGSENLSGHVNLGYHADLEQVDRSRFDYSVGGEMRIAQWATLLIDQVGRMEITGDDQIQKFDIVPGIKVNPWRSVIVGFNAVVPLNEDGLRTDFTPNGTAEVSMAF